MRRTNLGVVGFMQTLLPEWMMNAEWEETCSEGLLITVVEDFALYTEVLDAMIRLSTPVARELLTL